MMTTTNTTTIRMYGGSAQTETYRYAVGGARIRGTRFVGSGSQTQHWSLIRKTGTRGNAMRYKYNDGGRRSAGFRGDTGDCVTRAIAIATEMPYCEVYKLVNADGKTERARKNRARKSAARTGVYKQTTRRIMESLGWKWTPTMHIGQGCKVHMRAGELPSGRIIVKLSKHCAAVIDGVLHDTYDCTRDGTRCVYGYWSR